MKSSFLLLFIFGSIFSKAQDNLIVVKKKTDTIHSSILNEDRYLYIHVPETTKRISDLRVIYILDGEVFFDEVNNIMSRLSKESGRNLADKTIVVGIGNIWQRYRDYSPTHISSYPGVDTYSASISGGGEKFVSFIERELFPYIQSKYSGSSNRIIIGHSMGGLMVMNILLKHSDMFNYYAAIDPSMWWDDQRLLIESKKILAEKTFENRALFLAVANTVERDLDIAQIKKDTTNKTSLIRPSLEMADYLNNHVQNKLHFSWKFYKDRDHMSVPAPAIYDALRFFFN